MQSRTHGESPAEAAAAFVCWTLRDWRAPRIPAEPSGRQLRLEAKFTIVQNEQAIMALAAVVTRTFVRGSGYRARNAAPSVARRDFASGKPAVRAAHTSITFLRRFRSSAHAEVEHRTG